MDSTKRSVLCLEQVHISNLWCRLLLPSQVGEQTGKVVAPLSATRLVFTSLSSTALPMTNLLLPSWPLLAPQAWARPLS